VDLEVAAIREDKNVNRLLTKNVSAVFAMTG
jgi:hypothetical protein